MKKWTSSITSTIAIFLLAGGISTGSVALPSIGVAEELSVVNEKAASQAEKIPLQILGINDFHGALSTTGSFYSDAGQKVEKAGSAALLASYLNQAEKNFADKNETGTTFRVQSGDMVGASPANSALLQDEPTIKVLNQMNFTIGTLGNHEFDEGLAEFNRIMKGTVPTLDPYGILTSYPREASKTEIIIANVVKKGTEEIPFQWKPYTIKEVGNTDQKVKIGFIGVVTTEIPNLVLREHYEGYDFLDEAETIAYYSSRLKEAGVNAIVVLAHIPATSKDQQVNGEAAEILAKVNTIYPENSVDALFAGHNHQYTNGVVNKTRVVQSTSQGKGYIDLQGTLDVTTKDFVETPSAEVHPVAPTNAPVSDEKVAAIVKDADDRVQNVTSKKIGTATNDGVISREVNEFKESPLGNLITDGQVAMAKAKGINVDFAMTNNGGIRSDLLVGANREITWGAAQAVQPFGNIMQIVEMTGAQIEQVLNEQYDQEEKYFLQLSGLTYTFEETGNEQQPFKVHTVKKADGTVIAKDQTYLVVINDFLFGGGDGFSGFVGTKLVDTIQPDTETFISYIESKTAAGEEVAAKIEGRKAKYIEDVGGGTEVAEAQERIRKATIFDPLNEGNELLRGVTLPSAKISLVKGELPANTLKTGENQLVVDLVGEADANGKIKIDISSLKLKEGDKLTAIVADSEQNNVSFTLTVLKATSGLPNTNGSGTASSTLSPSNVNTTTNKQLPKTGEIHSSNSYLGFVAIFFSAFLWILNKKDYSTHKA